MICGQTLLLVPDTNWLRRSLDRDLGGSLGRLDAGEGFVRNALYHEIVQSTFSLCRPGAGLLFTKTIDKVNNESGMFEFQ